MDLHKVSKVSLSPSPQNQDLLDTIDELADRLTTAEVKINVEAKDG